MKLLAVVFITVFFVLFTLWLWWVIDEAKKWKK